jgi:hypothetical protein
MTLKFGTPLYIACAITLKNSTSQHDAVINKFIFPEPPPYHY